MSEKFAKTIQVTLKQPYLFGLGVIYAKDMVYSKRLYIAMQKQMYYVVFENLVKKIPHLTEKHFLEIPSENQIDKLVV